MRVSVSVRISAHLALAIAFRRLNLPSWLIDMPTGFIETVTGCYGSSSTGHGQEEYWSNLA
jgi:hypothetical protein